MKILKSLRQRLMSDNKKGMYKLLPHCSHDFQQLASVVDKIADIGQELGFNEVASEHVQELLD